MRAYIIFVSLGFLATASSQYPTPPALSSKKCSDLNSDCDTYTYADCRGATKDWGTQKCRKFCGYCGVGCADRLSNCPQFGRAACEKFPGWAEYNCAKTCDYCYTYKAPRWTDATCKDVVNNCPDYTGKVCLDPTYNIWVDTNCPRYCGRCGCQDKLPNCIEYGKGVCTGPHRLWAIANCPRFCKVCSLVSSEIIRLSGLYPPPTVAHPTLDPLSSGLCEDRLIECREHGADACAKYPQWAEDKCQKMCGYCGCQDKLSDCAAYGASACVAPYLDWALENCARTCRVCGTVKALKDRTASSACFDVASDCTSRSAQSCREHPTSAWATCGKTCKYCECFDTNSLCPFYNTPQICKHDFGKVNCMKTCGLCLDRSNATVPPVPQLPTTGPRQLQGRWVPDLITQSNPSCSDSLGSCAQFKDVFCTGPIDLQKSKCAKTCGVCNACEYKPTGRAAGETWTEGCDVTCTCALGGKVTCQNNCPVWDLKHGCQVKTAAGECCKKPTCPAGVKVIQPTARA